MTAQRREQIKSMVLAGLVLMSLVLSYGVWYGPPSEGAARLGAGSLLPGASGEALHRLPVAEATMPGAILLHEGEGQALLFGPADSAYAAIWERVRLLLDANHDALQAGAEAYDGALPPDHAGPLLELRLEGQLPASFWFDAWLWERAGAPGAPAPRVERLYLVADGGEGTAPGSAARYLLVMPPLYGEEGGAVALGPLQLPAAAGQTLTAGLDRTGGMPYRPLVVIPEAAETGVPIYVPAQRLRLPSLLARAEPAPRERLAEDLFRDLTLVQRLQDGSREIYTDGRVTLEFDEHGFRYRAPRPRDAGELGDLLQYTISAMAIIDRYGGWPQGLRLAVVEPHLGAGQAHPENGQPLQGLRVAFGQTPVLTDVPSHLAMMGDPFFAEVYLAETGVYRYSRRLTEVRSLTFEDREDTLTAEEAVLVAVSEVPPDPAQRPVVTGARLIYLPDWRDGGWAVMRPAWQIELMGQHTVTVDGYGPEGRVLASPW